MKMPFLTLKKVSAMKFDKQSSVMTGRNIYLNTHMIVSYTNRLKIRGFSFTTCN